MRRQHRRRSQPVPLQGPRSEVLDDHIGLRQKPMQEVTIGGRPQVSRDTELVAIDGEVVRALPPVVERRPPAPGVVTLPGPFDLDDIGAEVSEDHCRERSGEDARQIEYFDSRKGKCHLNDVMMAC